MTDLGNKHDYKQKALDRHKELRGKLSVTPKDTVEDAEKLSVYYTPGVGAVSTYVAEHPDEAKEYTGLNNTVAIVSDGSAVLGLGNLGPHGALPVMEGKSMLFKQFAGIDGVPIVLDVHSADEIVAAVKAIAPSFGAINLEDIGAPICFEVEERLKEELNIPVMHDDQHGTAVVVLAGLINAMKVVSKDLNDCKIVVSGVGAAGVAIMRLLNLYAPSLTIVACDSKGVINVDRNDLNPTKQLLLSEGIISSDASGSMSDALVGADIFVGVSQPGVLTPEMIKTMQKDPVIFALANPTPEVIPDIAREAGAAVVATGRSDFPNQVNNALAFPGIFRGALDNGVTQITDNHKIAAAEAIAAAVTSPVPEEVIPSIFTDSLSDLVSAVITS
ncbi:NADP-dependent malic enzyme [Candidatus Saccharibacteria bacterium]|nr:NADP-dependent malic enzyme [Candidatus Saccharibacteria bacterium]